MQPTDDTVQRDVQHLVHEVEHRCRTGMPAARHQDQPHAAPGRVAYWGAVMVAGVS